MYRYVIIPWGRGNHASSPGRCPLDNQVLRVASGILANLADDMNHGVCLCDVITNPCPDLETVLTFRPDTNGIGDMEPGL